MEIVTIAYHFLFTNFTLYNPTKIVTISYDLIDNQIHCPLENTKNFCI